MQHRQAGGEKRCRASACERKAVRGTPPTPALTKLLLLCLLRLPHLRLHPVTMCVLAKFVNTHTGLGSAVSCLFPLYRNRDALLSGLTHGSVVCGHAATGSGGGSDTAVAAAYLWDLRRPKKPASSLNFVPDPPSASSPHASSVLGDAASAVAGAEGGVPGILCLSVHEDGALAAAGFRDGKVLTWDMRQVRVRVCARSRRMDWLPKCVPTRAICVCACALVCGLPLFLPLTLHLSCSCSCPVHMPAAWRPTLRVPRPHRARQADQLPASSGLSSSRTRPPAPTAHR